MSLSRTSKLLQYINYRKFWFSNITFTKINMLHLCSSTGVSTLQACA